MKQRISPIGFLPRKIATCMAPFLAVVLSLAGAGHAQKISQPKYGVPCCEIAAIDSAKGMVTAKDQQGQTFQFQVNDRTLLASLHVGQKVYADFSTQQVSLDGAVPCCDIVGALPPQARTLPAPKYGVPCCDITAIDSASGMVTAKDPQGQTFQFRVDSRRLLSSLHVGQKVYANFDTQQVSIDGGVPCCEILPVLTPNSGSMQAPKYGGVPCCEISAIDTTQGIVTAKDQKGQGFQFAVDSRRLLASLRVGQKVYADFSTKKVSVDGARPCCGIIGPSVSIQSAEASGHPYDIKPNTTLKGSTGRLIVNYPGEASMIFLVFRPGEAQHILSWYQNTAGHLQPGRYDLKIWEARLNGVPVERGKDTRIHVGVLNIPIGASYEVYDQNKNKVFSGTAEEKSKIVLPAGKYYVHAAGDERLVSIQDGQITDY